MWELDFPRSPWFRYGAAVATVAPALVLSLALNYHFSDLKNPCIIFASAIVLTAFVGGFRPGLLATGISGLAIHFFFIPPIFTFGGSIEDLWRLVIFLVEGVILSGLTSALGAARPNEIPSLWQRYGAAALVFGVVFLLKLTLPLTLGHEAPFFLFTVAVLLGAQRGGLGPGLLNTILACLVAPYFFLEPRFEFKIAHSVDVLRMLVFLGEGILISGVSSTLFHARRRAEQHAEDLRLSQVLLASNEQRYRQLLEALTDYAVVLLDPQGRVLTWNRGAETIFGHSSQEVLGQPLDLLHLEDVPHGNILEGALREATQSGRWEGSGWWIVRGGKRVWAEVVLFAARPHGGTRDSFSLVLRDKTHQKRHEEALHASQEQFRRAQKLEAVGRLAGGVAHDFNNLLTVILGYCELLLLDLPPGGTGQDALSQIREAAIRASSLTLQLLAFSRRQVLQPTVLDLNRVIQEALSLIKRMIGEDILVVENLASNLWPVRADRSQLEQVLMNLAVNARDAMPRGGRLVVETANVQASVPHEAAERDAVLLSVRDSGTGMPPEVLEHIFEPFFTTKDPGKGTGLGLSTVHGIITQSEGRIDVESAPGKGTTFRIYLPRCLAPVEALSPAPVATPRKADQSRTLLVVEDENYVREFIQAVLRRAEYRVLSADSGAKALRLEAENPGMIDLLITDVVMPEMTGPELARRIQERRPGLPILFISGYAHDILPERGLEEGAPLCFLQKPFLPEALLDKVHEALAAR